MRQILLIAAAAALGFTATGCGGLGGGDTTTSQSPSPSPVPANPSPNASVSPAGQTANPNFSKPTVAQKNAPKGILPPDLISSTDPNQRVQQVKGDRSDPFALLPTTPSVQLAKDAASLTPAPSTPSTTTASANPGSTAAAPQTRRIAQAPSGSSTSRAGRQPTRTVAKPPTSPIAAKPPRPQPVLAQAVTVSGVVQVGDQVYAIVNAPNEPASRYVQEGQRLAGGQVLVRRIETNRAEPVVILEQNGVEVVRAVGESVPAAAAPNTGSPAT